MTKVKKFFSELLFEVKYVVNSSVNYFGKFLIFVMPYVMFYVGLKVKGGTFVEMFKGYNWALLLIPVLVSIVATYMKWYADVVGKGDNVPRPTKRFTEVSDDGVVSVEYDRMQEMLLYVADVEDYLKKRGIL